MIVGVDVGGTFTDVVAVSDGHVVVHKLPSTADQSRAVVLGARRAAGEAPFSLVHGTTVATNALLERTGATTALVTDEGFEDVIEIGRQDRPSLYDPMADRPEPLVPRRLRLGWKDGADLSLPGDVEAVAVVLKHAYADPARERAVARLLADTGVAISCSSEVSPEFREFERTSTTVLNAYLTPPVAAYLGRLEARLAEISARSVVVMRSSGGSIPLDEARRLPAAILLSGPAGGALAAGALGSHLGHRTVVSFDMGGTSTDVCLIEDGRPEVAYERSIAGHPCRMPAAAIHTVGAGGGSIAWIDDAGALRVGPRSAGADPGPACYGRGGTDATVTDANVVLGRIGPDLPLGGELVVDLANARGAIARLGAQIGLDELSTAFGILEVVEEHMASAIRTVSIDRGVDPRDAVLVAFGGAGGLHATALARALAMRAVVVPPHGGVFSALGLLLSPPRSDVAKTVLVGPDRLDVLDRAVADAAAEAATRLRAAGAEPQRVHTLVDTRYLGQAHELAVPYAAGEGWATLRARFHDAHRRRSGFARLEAEIEAVTVRAEAVGTPALTLDDLPPPAAEGEPRRSHREVTTKTGSRLVDVWWRPSLALGTRIVGPAVVADPDATTWVGEGETAVVGPLGVLEVTW
ncbi:MAG TPA: hydantoinase/oxoprolinase family protein [Actinobacteria bacterium]|nr:hydantoinase/oxoprolinase family protein [Actinomycetota bacterium]